MRKLLFILPNLEYSSAAVQVSLLAAGLPRDRFELRACALGGNGPAVRALDSAGLVVQNLGRIYPFNLSALWRLRRLVRGLRPDVIHTWGRPSWRMALLAGGRRDSRLLASTPLPPGAAGPRLGPGERWLLRRVDQVIARGPAEAEGYRRLGLPAQKVVVIPPGVAKPGAFRPQSSVLGSRRFLACVGPLEAHKGFQDAIWAFDILHLLQEDLTLVILGTGPDRERLEQFARAAGVGRHVLFTGSRADLTPVLARAEAVWVPSRAEGGVQTALEAMALGRPVVAARLPHLAEVVADGATGFLFAPGNKVELARRTRLLLDDARLCRRLGEAGQRRVRNHFAAANYLRRCADLYGTAPPADDRLTEKSDGAPAHWPGSSPLQEFRQTLVEQVRVLEGRGMPNPGQEP